MKYAIVVMDGAADEPLAELDGRTPLEKANIPHTDWISENGCLGIAHMVPDGFSPGSDVALMSLMGYAPSRYYTGRAPLEAAAQDIKTEASDWIFRCNLVTIADGIMEDYSAGHIDTVQAGQLINDLNEKLGNDIITFYPGISYRHLMVYKAASYEDEISPPHDITDRPISKYLPRGKHGKELCKLMDQAHEILAAHEVNKVRSDLGENPANNIWLWGQGHRPQMDNFKRKFGVSASVITAVDLVRGLGKLAGMKNVAVAGATGYFDTNYRGKGEAAIGTLQEKDLVLVHVEAPDEAGHGAMVEEKIQAIENIDKMVVGPLLSWLQKQKDSWRIMVLPDHPTPIRLRTHTSNPIPFTIAGTGIGNSRQSSYNEANAKATGLCIDKGHELMEYFLRQTN